ncbi:MauE/DoxX family redox-associated membrane protein [Ponticoccus alexandrii]|uniref:Methylamine utilization protein MauE n=1 Tax=Ponticoccus alexandrii TaxID=1943633 RepID=A0ABX7F9J7_9RHOB|nr:MauE/DoxX family redox-associated membrane protein [Ponticoccus alexandrii]ETA53015.1 membrane protein [Rhodobacteraceae bacterium PD-2]QRF66806.1 glutaredoxin [Ponticoccus alexandrii]
MPPDGPARTARLYRMVMPDHLCPFGLKSKWLLERNGYVVEDHRLTTRAETDRFMAQHGVKTTPQTFIGDKRMGGYEDLRRFFGQTPQADKETSYTPVIAVFAMAALMGLAAGWAGALGWAGTLRAVLAMAMALLAVQKLRDVESFSTMFLNYDLLARRWVPYGYLYPFAEGGAAILMLACVLPWLSGPVALFIGAVGAVSVIKAVYIDRRALKCACMGGNSNVPLGFVSLTENLVMVAMGLWMLATLT